MESKGSRGYLIPENIEPEGYRCFAMYVPDDDGYFEALSGHIHKLGTWQVWEKDGTTRAAIAASVWKDAIDLSIEELWNEGYVMTCENVEQLLTAIQNITINVDVSTGGCGCNVITDYKFPDGWETDTTTYPPRPADDTTPPVVTGPDFCDMCHEAYAQMYEMIAGFAESLSEYEPYYSIAVFFNTIAIAAPEVGDIYEAVSAWILAQYGNFVSDCQDYMEGMKDDLICILYNAVSSADAKISITNRIEAEPMPFEVKRWLQALYTGLTFNILYDGTLGARAELVGSDCSGCVGDVVEIAPGFFLMPVNTLLQSNPVNGGQLNYVGGNLWEIVAGANQGYELHPDLTEHGFDWDVNTGTSRMGYRVLVDTVTGGSFWMQGATQVFHGTIQDLIVNDDVRGRAATASPDLDAWLADGDYDAGMVGLNNPEFRFIQGGGAGLQTYRVYLWVIMDAAGQI